MDGAHCEEGAGFLRAHCGHCGFALCCKGTRQKENDR